MGPPKRPTATAGNPNDSEPSIEPSTLRRRPSPLTERRKFFTEEDKEKTMARFAKILAAAFQQLKREDEDSGKRIPMKAPETFDGSFSKFRRWWESVNEYFAIHQKRVPNDQTKIYSLGTFLRDQAADWYAERKRSMKALHLKDNWVAFSAAMEERFTDRQETGKDHEKLLALEYNSNMQTYCARFNEHNSRVQLTGQSLKRVLTVAVIPDMYRNI